MLLGFALALQPSAHLSDQVIEWDVGEIGHRCSVETRILRLFESPQLPNAVDLVLLTAHQPGQSVPFPPPRHGMAFVFST